MIDIDIKIQNKINPFDIPLIKRRDCKIYKTKHL
jgi:hypothetical protein